MGTLDKKKTLFFYVDNRFEEYFNVSENRKTLKKEIKARNLKLLVIIEHYNRQNPYYYDYGTSR